MVLVKILTFSLTLFFFKTGLNTLFGFGLEQKPPFLYDKTDIRRKSKIWHFSKEKTYGFGENFQLFLEFVFL